MRLSAVCLLLIPFALHAEPRIQPGALAVSSSSIRAVAVETTAPFSTTWGLSAASMATGVALDIASSWGHQEANPLVRSGDGTLRWKGAAMGVGFAAGTLAIQYVVLRRLRPGHPVRRVFTVLNFGVGTFRSGVAMRNWSR